VDRLALWKALRGIGISQYLLHLIEDLHNGSTSSVRIGSTLSASFTSTSGVNQGCVLAPALFCRAIYWIMERVASTVGFSLGNVHFTDLDYADDVALVAHAFIPPYRGLRGNSVTTWPTCVLTEDENSEPGCGRTNIQPISLWSVCGGSCRIYISGLCSIYRRQVSTRYS